VPLGAVSCAPGLGEEGILAVGVGPGLLVIQFVFADKRDEEVVFHQCLARDMMKKLRPRRIGLAPWPWALE